jgi:outer membrane protein OmpA-like peptidoglycan-associated protein
LYGSYPINTVNTREIFPSPEYSYKVEQISTPGDKFLSFFTGLFFSVNRKTLRVDICQTIKKEKEVESKTEIEKEIKVEDNIPYEKRINELVKEIAFLKGKISGIESAFPMISSLSAPAYREKESEITRNESSNRVSSDVDKNIYQDHAKSENSPCNEKNTDEADDSIKKITSDKSVHSYFLFGINSFSLSKKEMSKLERLSSQLAQTKSKVLIMGYADKSGNFKSNLNLSWKRAQEVKKIMMKLGLEESKIQLFGAGETGDSPTGKAAELARRVDVYVFKEEEL